MYLDFFGLQSLPFENRADTQFFFSTPDREETIAAMEYETGPEGSGIALLLGGAGVGKTLLLRELLLRFGKPEQAVVLTWPAGTEMGLIREACKGFGATLPSSYSETKGLARLRKHLLHVAKSGRRSILIVDQAEHLSPRNLAQLVSLMDLQRGQERLLAVILSAQPRFEALIEGEEFARLGQALFQRRSLDRLSLPESVLYVGHRLRVAGAGSANIIGDDAISIIHHAANGVPRLINQHGNAVLVAAYGAGVRRVDRALAEEVVGLKSAPPRADQTSTPTPSVATTEDARPAEVSETRAKTRDILLGVDSLGIASDWDRDARSDEPFYQDSPTAMDMDDSHVVAGPNHTLPSGRAAPKTIDVDVLARGEALLAHLERAMAKAERLSSTTTGMLIQSTAVEQHLGTLTQESEKRFSDFERTLHRLGMALDQAGARAQKIVQKSQRSVTEIEDKLALLPDRLMEADRVVASVEDACQRGGEIETGLRAFTDELADQADAVQERISVILAAVKASEQAGQELNEVTKKRQEQSDEARHEVNELAALVRKSRSSATEIKDKLASLPDRIREADRIVARVDDACQRGGETESGLRAFTDELADQADAVQERISVILAAVKASEQAGQELNVVTKKRQEQSDEAKHEVNELIIARQKQIDDAKREVGELAKARQQQVDEAKREVGELAKARQQQVDDAKRELNELAVVVQKAVDRADESTGGLRSAIHDACTQTDESATEIRSVAGDALAEAKRQFVRLTNEAVARYHKTLEERFERFDRAHGDVVTDMEQRITKLCDSASSELAQREAAFEATIVGFRSVMAEVTAEGESEVNRVQVAAETQRTKLGVTIEAFEERVKVLEVKASGTVVAIESKLNEAIQRSHVVCGSVDKEHLRLEELSHQLAGLSQSVSESQLVVGELASRAQDAAATVRQGVDDGNKLVQDVRTSLGQIQSAQRGVATTLVDIGAVCERATAARSQLEDCRAAADRIAGLKEESEAAATRIEEVVGESRKTTDALTIATQAADEKLGRIDSHMAAGKRLLHELSTATVDGRALTERTAAQVTQVGDTQQRVERLVEDVWSMADRAEMLAGRLEDRQQAAQSTLEHLDATQKPAHELAEQLESHFAQATKESERLAERITEVQTVTTEAQDAVTVIRSAIQTKDTITACLKKATHSAEQLTQKVDNSEDRINAGQQHAQEALELFQQTTQDVQNDIRDLKSLVADADAKEQSIRQSCADAERLAETMATVSAAARTAKEMESTIRAAAGEAESKRSQLVDAASEAAHHADSLRQVNDASSEIQARHMEVCESAERLTEELHKKASRVQTCTATAERLLEEFTGQAKNLQKDLQALHHQVTTLEKSVTDATTRPSEIVAQAQAQAAQLERVCAAVRKVFVGLSKATLDANKRTTEFTQTSTQAVARFEELQKQTSVASATLHEWVDEAVRAQARLERLLERTPSIGETHPGNPTPAWSDRISVSSRMEPAPKVGDLRRLSEPVVSEPAESKRMDVAKTATMPASRAEQVATLIKEAKQTVATKKDRLSR